jgi:hypothetical protein
MSENEIKEAINAHPDLKADESRYLGKINDAIPFILKAHYRPYIENIYIHFYKEKSYQIIILLNPRYFDFLNMSKTLETKYGAPSKSTSQIVEWGNDTNNIRLFLEYPATVKVYDDALMTQLHTELSQNIIMITNQAPREQARKKILDEF